MQIEVQKVRVQQVQRCRGAEVQVQVQVKVQVKVQIKVQV
jgi:hypothetical protein